MGLPGPHGIAVLFRHHEGDLGEVPEVVGHPRRQQLLEGDGAELRMLTCEPQLVPGQLQLFEVPDTPGPQLRETVQELVERPSPVHALVPEPVEGLEPAVGAPLQNWARP